MRININITVLHINLPNVTGGVDDDDVKNEDILEYKDGWKKVGQLPNRRGWHALSPVNFKDFAKL